MPDTLIPAHPLLLRHEDGAPWCGPVVYLGTPATLTHDGWLWDGHGLIGLGAEQPGSLYLDTSRSEVRDQCSRVLARLLGAPVGATAPQWWHWTISGGGWALGSGPDAAMDCAVFPRVMPLGLTDGQRQTWRDVPSLSSIPLDSPDRDALALASVVRWALAEVEAGRLTVKGEK